MSGAVRITTREITSRDDLVGAWQPDDSQPPLIGMEHEKWGGYLEGGAAVPYCDPLTGKPGMREVLSAMAAESGWEPGFEHGKLISLSRGGAMVTLEPACQAEHAEAPYENVHQVKAAVYSGIEELVDAARPLGIGFYAIGYHPTATASTLPDMPKARYGVLHDYADRHNSPEAHDMMKDTTSVQGNANARSEQDAVIKLRVMLNMQNVLTAMCANSPFKEGELSGHLSTRSHDNFGVLNNRYGNMLPVAFEDGFGFERFTDYVLNEVTMLGIYRGDDFIDAHDASFGDFLEGKAESLKGHTPTLADWITHMNTIWDEVRLRCRLPDTEGGRPAVLLEGRGPDGGTQEMIVANAAFITGIVHNPDALAEAYEKMRGWTNEDRDYLRRTAPTYGLKTLFKGATLGKVAAELVDIAHRGLVGRGMNEERHLAPFHHIVETGETYADRLVSRFKGAWRGEIRHLFNEMSYEAEPSIMVAPPALARRVTSLPSV